MAMLVCQRVFFMLNVGKHSIHGAYGVIVVICCILLHTFCCVQTIIFHILKKTACTKFLLPT